MGIMPMFDKGVYLKPPWLLSKSNLIGFRNLVKIHGRKAG